MPCQLCCHMATKRRVIIGKVFDILHFFRTQRTIRVAFQHAE